MPLELPGSIAQLESPDATLWRFMDFTKYVSMLHRQALFLARADQMPDPFEGSYARADLRRQRLREGELEHLRERVFLSCWHQNDHESAAMWRIYLSSEEGVAIRSTPARLEQALAACPERLKLGLVRYLDYEREPVPEQSELDPFFCKRQSFDYEREVRVLWCADSHIVEPGHYVPAKLERLIEQVVVSSTAERWFAELVSSVTAKYGYSLEVVPSSMLEQPY